MPQEREIMDKQVVAFMKDLRDIMIKHNVEITADDEWEGYAECGQDIQINIETSIKSIPIGNYITPDILERYIKVGEGA